MKMRRVSDRAEVVMTLSDTGDMCNGSDTESSVLCLGSRLPPQLSKACHSIQRNICLTSYWKFVALHYARQETHLSAHKTLTLTIKKREILFLPNCVF